MSRSLRTPRLSHRIGAVAAGFAASLFLLTVPHYADPPRAHVRWSAELSDTERAVLESQFSLSRPEPLGEESFTWRYALGDLTVENLLSLVEHPAVLDTHLIDRGTGELMNPPVPISDRVIAVLPWAFAIALLVGAGQHRLTGRAGRVRALAVRPSMVTACVWVVILLLVFAFQFREFDYLMNDHAGYLAMARQVVLGEWPIRDFLDHGTLLHILLSAAVQVAFGHHVLAEMIMCAALIAAGYILTFHLCARISGSRLIGFLLTLSCVFSTPRPYSHPKIFIYPVAIWLVWRYLRRPAVKNIVLLSLWAAVALSLRIDHGVAVFAATLPIVLLRRQVTLLWRSAEAGAWFLGAFVLWLTPFWVYLALSGGIMWHFDVIFEFGARALSQTGVPRLATLNLPADAPLRLQNLAVIYDLYLVVTVGAVLAIGWRAVREIRTERQLNGMTLRALSVLLVWLVSAPVLMREHLSAFDVRQPDVAHIVTILAAWLIGGLWWGDRLVDRPRRHARATASDAGRMTGQGRSSGWTRIPVLAGRGAAVVLLGMFVITGAYLKDGPVGAYDALRVAFRDAGQTKDRLVGSPPFSALTSNREVARYVYECTTPDDRILATWYAPEIAFAANRRFAGNQWVYLDNFQNSEDGQREVIRQLGQQSVPLVLFRGDEPPFSRNWSVLADHIDRRYVRVGIVADVIVYAHRQRQPIGRSSFANLPCFANGTTADGA
jgi:hypothetical protein